MTKLLTYLKPYRLHTALAVVFVLLQNIVTLLLPMMMSNILNDGVIKEKLGYIIVMGFVMLLIALGGCIISIFGNYFSVKSSMGFGALLRRAVFVKVQSLSQQEVEQIGTASLITRTTNDIQNLQQLVLNTLKIMISAPILIVGGSVMAFFMNKTLSLIVFIVIPIIAVIVAIVARKIIPLFKIQQKKIDLINLTVREKLTGIRVIRAFNRTQYEDEKFDGANQELADVGLKINRIFAVLIPLAYFLLYSTIAALVYFGSMQVDKLDTVTQAAQIETTVGNLQACIIYLLAMIIGIGMAASMFVTVPRALVCARRVREVLDYETAIKEDSEALPISTVSNEKGHVRFKNVKFSYPDAEEPVLSDITFEAKAGETIAIIGSTGSGKSSIVNLIPRFYDIGDGEIYIDGVEIRKIPQKDLHQRIGYVPQQAFLFSGSVADNLRYGKEDATEEEMWHALEIAQAAEFVRSLPEQLEDFVSQSGTNLSGGQKQRISIARAVIRNAEILIFDDSFSALDFQTDAKLRAALKKQVQNATIFIVAQRVNTVMDADQIMVLDSGRIVGKGRHKELLETCKVYREIVESQLSEEEATL